MLPQTVFAIVESVGLREVMEYSRKHTKRPRVKNCLFYLLLTTLLNILYIIKIFRIFIKLIFMCIIVFLAPFHDFCFLIQPDFFCHCCIQGLSRNHLDYKWIKGLYMQTTSRQHIAMYDSKWDMSN